MTLYQLSVENVNCQWKGKSFMCTFSWVLLHEVTACSDTAHKMCTSAMELKDVEQTCWESFIAGQNLLYESFQGWVDQWQIFVVECTGPERWGGADHGEQLPVASLQHNNPVIIAAERYGSILAYNSTVSCELSCLMFYSARFCCNLMCFCATVNLKTQLLWYLIICEYW